MNKIKRKGMRLIKIAYDTGIQYRRKNQLL